MKSPFLSVWVLLVAGLTLPTKCSAQTTALVDAPLPSEAIATAQPGDPGSSNSSLGVYPVANPQFREKPAGMGPLDWSMIGASAILRALDYSTTEKALSKPQTFHEAMLPQALVKNKPAFAAFEASTVGLNYAAYRLLVRHNKRSLARVSQYMYVGVMTFQVAHNYQLLGNAPAN